MNWKQIWNKRDVESSDDDVLTRLLRADGYDSGVAAGVNQSAWMDFVKFLREKLNVRDTDTIFEVGCGSGALLYPFWKQGHAVAGIDYSAPLIALANEVMPPHFEVREAADLETEGKFDVVLSAGVFHYFPDYKYASRAVERMIDKSKRVIAILDVPDLSLKEKSERARRAALPEGEYDKKYEGLSHLHYTKEWFTALGEKHGCTVHVFDQNLEGYGNSDFRFNVVFEKCSPQ